VRTKNLDLEVRKNLSHWETSKSGLPDLYIPFFELAYAWGSVDARIGYITPSTYLTSLNAKKLREFLLDRRTISKIVDFNGWQIFKGATTYTCVSILSKIPVDDLEFALVDTTEKLGKLEFLKFNTISLDALSTGDWRLLSKEDAEKIYKIETVGSPLFKYVNRFVTGIATLNNDLFLVNDNGNDFLEKEYNGTTYLIERQLTKKIIKPNRVKDQTALILNTERVIYPYLYRDGNATVMSEEYLSSLYPKGYEYLMAVKEVLITRDVDKHSSEWFAYGRSQGIKDFGKKIILPMMGNKATFIVVEDKDSLIYCGYALFPKKEEDYSLLEKILNSELMWFYIKKTSKNYSGGFKSFAKNYVKNFSIPEFTEEERKTLEQLSDRGEINHFLLKKYQLI
jgi:adenine-specific DNA-methyltransferase